MRLGSADTNTGASGCEEPGPSPARWCPPSADSGTDEKDRGEELAVPAGGSRSARERTLLTKLAGEHRAQFPVQGTEKELGRTLNLGKCLADKEQPCGAGGGGSVPCLLPDTSALAAGRLQPGVIRMLMGKEEPKTCFSQRVHPFGWCKAPLPSPRSFCSVSSCCGEAFLRGGGTCTWRRSPAGVFLKSNTATQRALHITGRSSLSPASHIGQ